VSGPAVFITIAVEGPTDEAIARCLAGHVGLEVAAVYGRQGKPRLVKQLPAYCKAAAQAPWLILLDLDSEAECAPELLERICPQRPPKLCCRLAVRAAEAWLLADAERLAQFLRVSETLMPRNPDSLQDPKEEMVNLARRSRSRSIREGMSPRPRSGRRVGPEYTSWIIAYVRSHWQVASAVSRSDSLARAVRCLERLSRLQ
jgi:hypothetical protein